METKNKKPNRLINEKSPYLLQHAYNPVDWYPWSEEAFEKAKKEDKPIFLSIGYSTCHWCHVMEHESFEDEEVAKIINENFVPIKVDREERPDIDNIYMNVCMMMTGGGGWPLTILMTPDKKPFYAGTYFPKESSYTRIGIKDLLLKISEMWKNERESLIKRSEKVMEHLKDYVKAKSGNEQLPKEVLDHAYEELKDRFDRYYGGFGNRPKFPSPHNFMFLLRYWKRTGKENALQMVEHSLKMMRLGGIFDQIGFGFHRYSTDERWFLPHFEKMLYDQAMLSMAYTETYQATKNPFYRKVAEEIFEYVLRDMTDKNGGFYSAEDADSEGEEGKFYVWSYNEIKKILGEDSDLFVKIFNITEEGTYREEATGKPTGTNIPYLKKPLDEIAEELGVPFEELEKKVEEMRKKLFEIREKRVHPLKDDKILTDWNGLMIAALSKGAQAFNNSEYLNSAKKSADFILDKMKMEDGGLYHRYRDGEVSFKGNIDDYAFMVWGLIELYEASFETKYLEEALNLTNYAVEHFWDKENGGFYFTPDNTDEELIIRQKEVYDGAYPSGNSVMLYNLARLSKMTGKTEFEKYAEKETEVFSFDVQRMPSAHTMFLIGFDFMVNETSEIVIVGEKDKEDTRKFIRALYDNFEPFVVALLKYPTSNLEKIAEYTKNLTEIEDKATAYVCKNFNCNLPTTDIGKFLELVNK
jgi:hypothetical protein